MKYFNYARCFLKMYRIYVALSLPNLPVLNSIPASSLKVILWHGISLYFFSLVLLWVLLVLYSCTVTWDQKIFVNLLQSSEHLKEIGFSWVTVVTHPSRFVSSKSLSPSSFILNWSLAYEILLIIVKIKNANIDWKVFRNLKAWFFVCLGQVDKSSIKYTMTFNKKWK